jgi:hypothetical protein
VYDSVVSSYLGFAAQRGRCSGGLYELRACSMAQLLEKCTLQVSQCATCAICAGSVVRRGCLMSGEPASQPALICLRTPRNGNPSFVVRARARQAQRDLPQ